MPTKDDEEYEMIPISPIRRLEKRIDQLESSPASDTKELMHDIVDIVRMNQQIVDELAKANDALRIEISRLPSKIEDLIKNLSELISYIKASTVEETTMTSDAFKPLVAKLEQLIETNKKIADSNETSLGILQEIDKKMKPALPARKPLLPMRPY